MSNTSAQRTWLTLLQVNNWLDTTYALYVHDKIFVLICLAIVMGKCLLNLIFTKKLRTRKHKWRELGNLPIHLVIVFGVVWFCSLVSDTELTKFLKGYQILIWLLVCTLIALLIKNYITYWHSKYKIIQKFLQSLYLLVLLALPAQLLRKDVDTISLLNTCVLLLIVFYFGFLAEKVKHSTIVDKYETSDADDVVTTKEQLFPTRLRDYNRILNYLLDIEYSEPFAVAINAGWGEGKSTLVNVLSSELQRLGSKVILIKPTVWDTRDKLVEHFFSQLEQLLREHGVFTGRGSPFKEYVDLIGKITKNELVSSFAELFGIFEKEKPSNFREVKQNLEGNIQEILSRGTRIYLVVDDFDRVEDSTMFETLIFIKEIVGFARCGVLFLMHYELLSKNDRVNQQYLEKFIGKRFDLEKVGYEEMVDYYVFQQHHLKKDDEFTVIQEEVNILKQNVSTYITDIFSSMDDSIKKAERELSILSRQAENMQEEKDSLLHQIEIAKNEVRSFKTKCHNPRRLKRVFREMREAFEFVQSTYQTETSETMKQNWSTIQLHKIVFNITVLKNLVEDQYETILKGGLEAYLQTCNSKLAKTVLNDIFQLSVLELDLLTNEIRMSMYNTLIFNRPSDDRLKKEIKTQTEQLLSQLDSSNGLTIIDRPDVDKLNSYFDAIRREAGNVPTIMTNQRIRRVLDSVFTLSDEGKLKLWDITFILDRHAFSPDLFSRETYFWDEWLRRLRAQTIVFNSDNQKTQTIYRVKLVEEALIENFIRDVQLLLWLINFVHTDSSGINLENIRSLSDLNGRFLTGFPNLFSPKDDVPLELERFQRWTQSAFNEVQNYTQQVKVIACLNYVQQRMQLFIDLYRSYENVLDYLQQQSITASSVESEPVVRSIEDASASIQTLKTHLETQTPDEDSYIYYHALVRQILVLSSQNNVPQTLLDEVLYVYNILCQHWNDTLYYQRLWVTCALQLAALERNLATEQT